MSSNLRIEKLILNNFRNHNYLKLDIKKNMVLIYGKNGSGKTSVLESISLFDSSNGFKALSLNETINFNYKGPLEMFGVNLSLKSLDSLSTVGLSLRKKNDMLRKVISIDGKLSKKSNPKILNVYPVFPKMTFLFQNSSEDRRGFLDQMISTTDKEHRKNLINYEKYKSERIKILKKWKNRNTEWLDAVEKKMVFYGMVICDCRRNFVKSLNHMLLNLESSLPYFQVKLNGKLDKLLLEKPSIQVEDFFSSSLKENRTRDSIIGRTSFSANKTDIIVYEKKSNKEAKSFSTGQQKTILFLMIFAFIKHLETISYERIIFLLDDVFSYLDDKFIYLVLEKLNELNVQIWMTDVKGDWIFRDKRYNKIVDKINIDDKRFKVN